MNKLAPAILSFSLLLAAGRAQEVDLHLDLDPQRATIEFEGIGAVSAGASSRLLIDYPEPSRSRILDWLFLPKYGAGFQHLKVEVGGEINSTDGVERSHARSREELDHPKRSYFERGYQWWLMKEAKRRNPHIILDCLAWGAPGWIGNGDYFSQDMADYLVGFIQGAKQFHGLEIALVGGWNEKPVPPEWIKLLRHTLNRAGLSHVNIVGGDMNGPPEAQWKIAEQAAADPELAACLYAIGVHYPYGELPPAVSLLRRAGIRTWSSEHGEWDWQTMQPFLTKRAASMNRTFLERKLTKINFWSPVTSYYDCLPAPRSGVVSANSPWSGAFEIAPTCWAVAHFTQFAEPGWRFIDNVGCMLPQGGSIVGLTSPNGKDISVIIETTEATADQSILITTPTTFPAGVIHLWRTDQMEQFIQQEDLTGRDGQWRLTVNPNCIYTLTTTTGQRKGIASSPPFSPFPLPYQEDFEHCRLLDTAPYLCDQGGAFEVINRPEGGQCLQQQVYRPGIDWARAGYAYSVIGDDHWNDVEVTVDAALTEKGRSEQYIGVIARWHPGSTWIHFTTPHPAGYCFRLFADGNWQISTARRVIAAGKTNPPGLDWRRLTLRCVGDHIIATLDGKQLIEIKDSTYQRGLVGITSRFHPARFDNLMIQ